MIPVVSFYTSGTPYEKEAQEMKASANRKGLSDVSLFKVGNLGSWALNCQQKVEVLLEACRVIQEPFLYVDADARFKQRPTLLYNHSLSEFDIGIHYFKQVEVLSGTIWINPTERTFALLHTWQQLCKENPRTWDQKLLEAAIAKHPETKVFKLPPEYTWIFDLSLRFYGDTLSPVIVHNQASRKYKRIIGK